MAVGHNVGQSFNIFDIVTDIVDLYQLTYDLEGEDGEEEAFARSKV
jgi:hypothetical protein